MPCYHPITAVGVRNRADGKMTVLFPKNKPAEELVKEANGEILHIPCGQCLGCRLEYSRQWAIRCCLEAKQWSCNYFVTLTYDPEHVPIREHFNVDKSTGDVIKSETVMTLNPSDLQKFIKRLRINFQREYGHTGIRFFACGEYGAKNARPHYHLILFNCPFQDLKLDRVSGGFAYYRSALLEKTWPYGMSIITDFSFQTAGYVARYMLKKHKGKDTSYYESHGIEPEFTRCSRRPGLGKDYYELHKDEIYRFDNLYVGIGGGKTLLTAPPKYFDRLFELEEPDILAELKERRKDKSERSMANCLASTSLGLENYLKVCENNKSLSISHLSRNI